jgi:lysyl-tRNA synthetase class 2
MRPTPRSRSWNLGDILGAEGTLFKTKTGEVTVRVERYVLLSKALRPLPEKWHGLSDPEQVYRQRYLDLIVNPESRNRLLLRSRVVSGVRRFLEARQFIEVETPVLQSVAGGAGGATLHHPSQCAGHGFCPPHFAGAVPKAPAGRAALTGSSRSGATSATRASPAGNNPEFTMLEVYQAYSDFRGMMSLVRDLLQTLCRDILGTTSIRHAASGQDIEFAGDWRRSPVQAAHPGDDG